MIALLLEFRRSIAGSFEGLKGGSQAGLALAYAGSFVLVAAQLYTIVKRECMDRIHQESGRSPAVADDTYRAELHRSHRCPLTRWISLRVQFP